MESIFIALWVFYGAIIAVIGMAVTKASNDSAGAVVIIAMFGGAVLSVITGILVAPFFGYRSISKKGK